MSVEAFLAAIMERTPNGERIAVEYHPDGDWFVAAEPLSRPQATDEGVVDIDAATPKQIERANAAVQANLTEDGLPKYDSAQGYACALTAIKQRDKVIAEAADAIDIADGIIEINVGTDTPKEWDRAIKRVARARSKVSSIDSLLTGEG